MRLFQNSGIYRAYRPRLRELTRNCKTFEAKVDAFLRDRYGAAHFLVPILERADTAFFTNSDDEQLQRQWAREQGLPAATAPEIILLSKIDSHRTGVF